MTSKIKVMISSRCTDNFLYQGTQQSLTVLRRQIKREITSTKLIGERVFDCWINDDPKTPAGNGSESSWDYCMSQVSKAQIVIGLFTGRAGWTRTNGAIGICHAEMEQAMNTGGAKLRVINLQEQSSQFQNSESASDKRFKDFVALRNPFWGTTATDGDDVILRVKLALIDAVYELLQLGVREARKAKYDSGEALEWSNLDYRKRKEAIEGVMHAFFKDSFSTVNKKSSKLDFCDIGAETILVNRNAIPDVLSEAAARELVGQPQLYDFTLAKEMKKNILGPLHFIGCFHGVTEKQAKTLLGSPDITTVNTSFGVYAADNINKAQVVFISHCRDSTAVRNGLDKFFAWVGSANEGASIADRASSRKKIIAAIAAERK